MSDVNWLTGWTYAHHTPLDCQCETPTPTPTDMCARCLRVIAQRVRARRQAAG